MSNVEFKRFEKLDPPTFGHSIIIASSYFKGGLCDRKEVVARATLRGRFVHAHSHYRTSLTLSLCTQSSDGSLHVR